MVVEVRGENDAAPGLEKPQLLFETDLGGYDVAPEGDRYVMLEPRRQQAAPTELVLVQNWAQEVERLAPSN